MSTGRTVRRLPSAPAPAPDDAQIWVAVFGSLDVPGGFVRDVPGDFVLDVGATQWRVGSGGAMAAAFHESVPVRLLQADTCATIVAFTAAPGSRWIIRFPPTGVDPAIEDWTDLGFDTGAMIQPDTSAHCALPNTDTVDFGRGIVRDPERALVAVLIGIALLVVAVVGWRLQATSGDVAGRPELRVAVTPRLRGRDRRDGGMQPAHRRYSRSARTSGRGASARFRG